MWNLFTCPSSAMLSGPGHISLFDIKQQSRYSEDHYAWKPMIKMVSLVEVASLCGLDAVVCAVIDVLSSVKPRRCSGIYT